MESANYAVKSMILGMMLKMFMAAETSTGCKTTMLGALEVAEAERKAGKWTEEQCVDMALDWMRDSAKLGAFLEERKISGFVVDPNKKESFPVYEGESQLDAIKRHGYNTSNLEEVPEAAETIGCSKVYAEAVPTNVGARRNLDRFDPSQN
jgi:hypothetical protein